MIIKKQLLKKLMCNEVIFSAIFFKEYQFISSKENCKSLLEVKVSKKSF